MLRAGAVFALAAVAFALLAVAVARRSGPLGPDERVLQDVVHWRSGALTALGKTLTTFGTDVVVYPLLVLGALVCWRRTGRPLAGVPAIAVLVTGQLIRIVINRTIARPRPPAGLHLVNASGYAFPSGHTTNATLAYALLAIVLTMNFPRGRWAFITGAAILAIGVGLSRVYLSVHWATDVAGGWLLGISWLTFAALVTSAAAPATRNNPVSDGKIAD
jgi:membrane-associated phospholipid phosphatase